MTAFTISIANRSNCQVSYRVYGKDRLKLLHYSTSLEKKEITQLHNTFYHVTPNKVYDNEVN